VLSVLGGEPHPKSASLLKQCALHCTLKIVKILEMMKVRMLEMMTLPKRNVQSFVKMSLSTLLGLSKASKTSGTRNSDVAEWIFLGRENLSG
jgi:hypothetical protein